MAERGHDPQRRIADRVRALRAAAGLSLDALAQQSGVSRSMISLVERGESSPTAAVLERLASGLGVTIASLFDPAAGPTPAEVGRPAQTAAARMPAGAPLAGNPLTIRRLHELDQAQIDELATVLIDCVEGGASVSFMLPLPRERAQAFWTDVAAGVARGDRALLVAEDALGICGTVQLVLAQPDNQPHRADLAKMLVHRRARRLGLGAALMRAAEATARDCGKTVLVLDTVTGGDAERLYERLGWQRVGEVPNYALWPQGGLCSTTFFYRALTPSR